MMKAILFKLVFFFSTFLVAQTIAGSYDNDEIFEEIFINGLSIKPGRHIPEEELKAALEINPDRTAWGIGIDWNQVVIDAEESDYEGTLVTDYDYNYLSGEGFTIDIAGYENDYGFVPGFSLQSPNIVVGFLDHKFIIGTTKKEEVEDLFYNGKVNEEYKNGYSGFKVFTHGGQFVFVFDAANVLYRIYLRSF